MIQDNSTILMVFAVNRKICITTFSEGTLTINRKSSIVNRKLKGSDNLLMQQPFKEVFSNLSKGGEPLKGYFGMEW